MIPQPATPSSRRFAPATLAVASVLVFVLAGCTGLQPRPVPPPTYADLGFLGDATGADAAKWPDFEGESITILDNGAFEYGCDEAAPRFKELTGVDVTCENGGDAGTAISKLKADGGAGTYDILYGADNALLGKATPYLLPYKPVHSGRVPSSALFWGPAEGEAWIATPVDQGYVGINWDREALNGTTIDSLHRVRDNASEFVTQCPNQSSPGLAFMLVTIAKFGESDGVTAGNGPQYDWHDYWEDLFARQVTVTTDWTDAYVNHFSAGFGNDGTHASDKAIVTSYTESPAYEVYSGRPAAIRAEVLLEPKSTFHQIQTMGIVQGTKHLAAAQAFIEYALTNHFQNTAAPASAVYPIVPGISVTSVYAGLDPAPGSFQTANSDLSYTRITNNLDRWFEEWNEMAPASVQSVCGAISV